MRGSENYRRMPSYMNRWSVVSTHYTSNSKLTICTWTCVSNSAKKRSTCISLLILIARPIINHSKGCTSGTIRQTYTRLSRKSQNVARRQIMSLNWSMLNRSRMLKSTIILSWKRHRQIFKKSRSTLSRMWCRRSLSTSQRTTNLIWCKIFWVRRVRIFSLQIWTISHFRCSQQAFKSNHPARTYSTKRKGVTSVITNCHQSFKTRTVCKYKTMLNMKSTTVTRKVNNKLTKYSSIQVKLCHQSNMTMIMHNNRGRISCSRSYL